MGFEGDFQSILASPLPAVGPAPGEGLERVPDVHAGAHNGRVQRRLHPAGAGVLGDAGAEGAQGFVVQDRFLLGGQSRRILIPVHLSKGQQTVLPSKAKNSDLDRAKWGEKNGKGQTKNHIFLIKFLWVLQPTFHGSGKGGNHVF